MPVQAHGQHNEYITQWVYNNLGTIFFIHVWAHEICPDITDAPSKFILIKQQNLSLTLVWFSVFITFKIELVMPSVSTVTGFSKVAKLLWGLTPFM